MDEPSGGTQRFSGHWIHTNVFVTQADILTSALSIHIYMKTSPKTERSPTDFSLFFQSPLTLRLTLSRRLIIRRKT